MRLFAPAIFSLFSWSCGNSAGVDGSELLVPYDLLGGGVVFATTAIIGSAGYDLYWVSIPSPGNPAPQGFVRLTEDGGDERQPSVSKSGNALAFATSDGIHVVSSSNLVKRVSDTRDTPFADSLPSLSVNGDRVAWVREDTSRPIGDTGFFEAFIMMANADGSDPRALDPRTGIVQDAPVFDPDTRKTRLAWSEFDPTSIQPGVGPRNYGLRVFDYVALTGIIPCSNENDAQLTQHLPRPSDRVFRCYGQHLAWPVPTVLVVSQDLLEVSLDGGPFGSIYDEILQGLQTQQLGIPEISPRTDGFRPAFPLSASYTPDASGLIFDGVLSFVDGNLTSLSFFAAGSDGANARRVSVSGHQADLDLIRTHNFLFSLSTPQFMPIR